MSIGYFDDLEFLMHGEQTHFSQLYYRPNFDHYWGIQFSRSGLFRLQIGNHPAEESRKACAFLSFPGVPFLYGAADAKGIRNKVYVCFRGPRVERYLAGGLLTERRKNALIDLADPDGFLARLRRLRALLMMPDLPGSHAEAVLLLERLLLEMQHSSAGPSRSVDEARDKDFRQLTARITAQPECAWEWEAEARKLGLSQAHFRRLFERYFQRPPGAFLLAARLEKAAALLRDTQLSVRAVATECGFRDAFYFSRIFRKHRGMAPSACRQPGNAGDPGARGRTE